MKNICIRKQRREHACLRRFWAPAFCAAMILTAGTLAPTDRGFAAEVFETRLRGGVDDPNSIRRLGRSRQCVTQGF